MAKDEVARNDLIQDYRKKTLAGTKVFFLWSETGESQITSTPERTSGLRDRSILTTGMVFSLSSYLWTIRMRRSKGERRKSCEWTHDESRDEMGGSHLISLVRKSKFFNALDSGKSPCA